MTIDRCPMAALVEARQSGRVGDHENRSLESHLAVCPECADLARDLRRLADLARRPVAPLPELDRRRARLRLLREAASEPARPRARAIGFAVAIAAAAAVIGVVRLQSATPPAPVAIAPVAASASAAAIAPAARTATIVRGEDGARFTRSEADGTDRVTLEAGRIEASVRPLRAGERFLVATSDAEVEVRGTVFQVRAEDGRIAGVSVTEGKVEVRFDGRAFLVAAGDTWNPAPRPTPTASAAARPADRGAASVADGRPPPTHRPAGSEAAAKPAGAGSASKDPGADDPASIFAAGVESLGRGEYEAAARRLAEFRARAPGDPRAEDAAFLTVLALDRSGQKAEAKAAARRYLEEHPGGHRAAEARAIADR